MQGQQSVEPCLGLGRGRTRLDEHLKELGFQLATVVIREVQCSVPDQKKRVRAM